MADVLFVSKAVTPPWNDSSKNLVRDLAGNLSRHTPIVMGRGSGDSPLGVGRVVDVYGAQSRPMFSPPLRDNMGVLAHLLWGPKADLWHFFFAPNRKSSAAGRFARTLRRVPSLHTICSLPAEELPLGRLLFADLNVVLSRNAYERFRAAGVADSALRIVPPSVPALPEPDAAERAALRRKLGLPSSAPIWIYPGDLEHGGGAEVALEAFASWNESDALLLMACRDKTAGADPERSRLREHARRWGIEDRVRWLGETPEIHDLLAASDFVVLPNRSGVAKMDYPLVALEAMALGRPVFLGSDTPAAELADAGAAVAVESQPDALASAITALGADEAARAALRRSARELLSTSFSPQRVAAAYERIYEELLA
jgi:phosphatidylinositol alpha-1,6-mannosyltransferase